MQKLATILPSVLRQRGLDQAFSAGLIILKAQEWIESVLPVHARSIKAKSINDGLLIITAIDSIALQEMIVRTDDLLTWLNAEVHSARVVTVKVIRG